LEQRSGAARRRRRLGNEEKADLDGEEEDPTGRRTTEEGGRRRPPPWSPRGRQSGASSKQIQGGEWGRSPPGKDDATTDTSSLPLSVSHVGSGRVKSTEMNEGDATAMTPYKGGRFRRWRARAEVSSFSREPV
jgi:hypothetical protein